jgi:hypothetical protein
MLGQRTFQQLANDLFASLPKHPFGSPVDIEDSALPIQRQESIADALDNRILCSWICLERLTTENGQQHQRSRPDDPGALQFVPRSLAYRSTVGRIDSTGQDPHHCREEKRSDCDSALRLTTRMHMMT